MGTVLTFLAQFGGNRVHSGRLGLLGPVVLVVFVVCVGAVMVPLLGVLVSNLRGLVRGWRAGRQDRRRAAEGELQARAMMSELCPHGWRAQITMLAAGDQSEPGREGMVALDWMELQDDEHRAAVMRRVWAPTVGEALEAMVADRRTDETLEQIEQGAVADGARWPDA